MSWHEHGPGRGWRRHRSEADWSAPDDMGRAGRREWRRGMRAGRMFDQADLRLVILHLIAEAPRHGYELIKAIEEMFAGAYAPSPGMVYPALTMLEEMGYAAQAAPAESAKKLFAITEEGRAFVTANQARLDEILARIDAFRRRVAEDRPSSVFRAMQNLRLALRMRLEGAPLTEAQIRAITAAIDAAAVEVERV